MAQTEMNVVLSESGIVRRVLSLAWPSIIESVAVTAIGFVDTAMVGGLGAEATAAVAINSSPMWLINAVMMAVSVGGTVLVARSIGAQKPGEAHLAARQSLLLALGMGVLLTIIMQSLSHHLPMWMGAEPHVLPVARSYLRTVSSAYLLQALTMVLYGVFRGMGDTRTPMMVVTLSNVINMTFNYLLIFAPRQANFFGLFTFPMWGANLGVMGAALGTVAAQSAAGIIMLVAIFRRNTVIRQRLRESWKPDADMLKRLLKVGLPTALERISISGGHMMFQRMVAGLGTVSLAANHLAVQAESISYMPVYGFQTAATTLTGQSLGAERPDLAKRCANVAFYMALGLMSFMGIVLFFFPQYLMRLFTPDAAVIAAGAAALRVEALAQPFFATAIVLTGALRGAGDTKAPMTIAIVSMWGVRLIVAYLCAYKLGLGLTGAWIGMAVELAVRGTLTYLRYRGGRWSAIKV